MKKSVFILVSLALLQTMFAQTSFEEYQRQKNAKFQTFKDQKQQDFDAYRREKNARYAEFLKKKWGHYEAAPKDTTKPVEPVVPPIIPEPSPQPDPAPIKIDKDIIESPVPEPQPEPIVPIIPQEDQNVKKESIVFYGTSVTISFPNPDDFKFTTLDDAGVVVAWEHLMDAKYDVVISSALDVRKKLELCDWAYMEMIQQICNKHYGKMSNEADMMLAYILIQSGYKIRFAYSDSGRLYVLINSNYEIYEKSYFAIDGERFYPLNCNEHSLYISTASFDAEKSMSLQISKEQKFAYEPTASRTISSQNGITATVRVNQNDIDFYNSYPTACINDDFGTRWAAYANTPLEKKIKDSLYPPLKKAIAGKDVLEQANIILHFVQTAFEYGYDSLIWGEDRAFFATETLYYPYSDCEDHSILFSRLIRDILDLDVVLLYYPGHLATAVKFNSDVKGDYLTVKGKKYIVCDPTCVGAPVGMSCADEVAKVIVLND